MTHHYRPVIGDDPAGLALAGGWCRFSSVDVLSRGESPQRVSATDIPEEVLTRLTAARPNLHDLPMSQPQIMGIINATPDSFSDGGDHLDVENALLTMRRMIKDGTAIIDIGGESTRPGAVEVPAKQEAARVTRALRALRKESQTLVSIDTRKATVAAEIREVEGAAPWMINDVSAMRFDADMAAVAAKAGVPICLMHSIGTPETMQSQATYDDVLLDVYDHLEERIGVAEAAGITRSNIIVDPGIGFGKTLEHNLVLLRGISLFHGLGCPILLGASRKRFIGTIGRAEDAKDRLGGSVSVALHGVSQGVQILRVHDTFATKQAIDLHMAIHGSNEHDT